MKKDSLLDGDWDHLWAALNRYRLEQEAHGTIWKQEDGQTRNSYHSSNVAKIFESHISFQTDEPLTFWIYGGSGCSSIDFFTLADIAIQNFRTDLNNLKTLCQNKFSKGHCPMRIFVEIGTNINTKALTDNINIQAPDPNSWWAKDLAFNDPKPLGTRQGSRLCIEFLASFELMKLKDVRLIDSEKNKQGEMSLNFNRLEIAFLCLGLCNITPLPLFWSNPTIQHIGWSIALGIGSTTIVHTRGSSDYTELQEAELQNFKKLMAIGDNAPLERLRQLWVPATKLFGASSQSVSVDSLVDLRTALEAFFIGEEQNELSYRLATRFARSASTDLEEKRNIFISIKTIYKWCSAAVHTGSFPNKFDKKIYDRIIELFRLQIISALEYGVPDWATFDLE